MACFLVPTAEAVVVTAVRHIQKKKEAAQPVRREDEGAGPRLDARIPFSRKLGWLLNMLWGGSILLAFEHVWHGEVTPWFPFLTAAADPADTAEMLHEMATIGVTMAVLVTVAWAVMVLVSNAIEKRVPDAVPASE